MGFDTGDRTPQIAPAAPVPAIGEASVIASSRRAALVAVMTIAGLMGCASTADRTPVPEVQVAAASTPLEARATTGPIRMWGDAEPEWFDEFIEHSSAELEADLPAIYGKRHNYLALSGGGLNGAFGAGVLNGWTLSGKRPEFSFVTGISTGSLIAPFAFLGPAYDPVLTEIYTRYGTDDLIREKPLPAVLGSDSAMDPSPLRALIAQYMNKDVIAKIAAEHRKGRRLWIGTTNLDAGRPVVWNIGEIANSQDPRAHELIHDILLASSSVPGAFPPVQINVEVNGETFDELHVDGGVTTQVFFYPVGLDWRAIQKKLRVPSRPNLYIIRNASLNPTYEPTERRLLPIAGRSISALIRTQGIGDLYKIYVTTERDNINFNLAFVPDEFDLKAEELFDLSYMKALYLVGLEMGRTGDFWKDEPPPR